MSKSNKNTPPPPSSRASSEAPILRSRGVTDIPPFNSVGLASDSMQMSEKMYDVLMESLQLALLESDVDKIKKNHTVRVSRDIQLQAFQYRQNRDRGSNFSPCSPTDDAPVNACELNQPRI